VKRISRDEIQQALAEHTEAMQPSQTDTPTQNDWTKCAGLTTLPPFDVNAARAVAHERIRKANATKQN
jgi:hypothetical protein